MRKRNNRRAVKPFKKKVEIRSSKKWGNNVDEAVEAALADLGVGIDEVEVTVLEEPSRGFLGLGSKMALVEVTMKSEEASLEDEVHVDKSLNAAGRNDLSKAEESFFGKFGKSRKQSANDGFASSSAEQMDNESSEEVGTHEKRHGKSRRGKRDMTPISMERPKDLLEVQDHIAGQFVKNITDKMGLNLAVKVTANNAAVYVDLEGEDAGAIIGKRGQTLDALQYLTSLVVNKDSGKYIRVVLDTENYRSKREKTLQSLAFRLASKVEKTGKSVRLEPMNPYERKIIHSVLQQHNSVVTSSEGEEPYRRLIIRKKK